MTDYSFSTLELAQLKADNEGHLMDECTILTRSDALDAAGQPIPSWAEAATAVPCGFGFSPFKFRSREISVAGAEETSEILVRARISLDYFDTISQNDRLKLTKRFGSTYTTPETYEVQGFLERGPSGLVVNLKRVEL